MTKDDDFSKYPESVRERRANKAEAASLWTPRDALIAALREIDSQKILPFVCFLALGEQVGETPAGTHTKFFCAGNSYEVRGVAQRALWMLDSGI